MRILARIPVRLGVDFGVASRARHAVARRLLIAVIVTLARLQFGVDRGEHCRPLLAALLAVVQRIQLRNGQRRQLHLGIVDVAVEDRLQQIVHRLLLTDPAGFS